MAVGDVLFYHSDDIGGTLIQWRTHGPYTHVCVEVEGGHVIEAKWPIVSYDVPGVPAARFTPVFDKTKLPAALTWLHSTVGDKYDVWDIVANAFNFLAPHTKMLDKTPTAFICSELTAYFLLKAGFKFPPAYPTDEKSMELTTPNDVARMTGILHA